MVELSSEKVPKLATPPPLAIPPNLPLPPTALATLEVTLLPDELQRSAAVVDPAAVSNPPEVPGAAGGVCTIVGDDNVLERQIRALIQNSASVSDPAGAR